MYRAYASCPGKDILLWCDSREDEDGDEQRKSKKSKTSNIPSKREDMEDRIADLAKELEEAHAGNLELNELQYRMWARLIVTGAHFSKDKPPKCPMITGSTPRCQPLRKDVQESIVSTAAAVVKAVMQSSPNSSIIQLPQVRQTIGEDRGVQRDIGISPGKVSEIRGKGYSQLGTLKQLLLENEAFSRQSAPIKH